MKKCKLLVLTLMIILIFTSCDGVSMLSDGDADIYAKIHDRYMKMSSYSADVTMTAKSNKTENVYSQKQYFLAPDKKMAVFSDGGAYVISKDEALLLYDGKSAHQKASDDINYLFLDEFFKLYYMAKDTAISVLKDDSLGTTRLEAEIPNATAHRYKLALTINNKTLNPERLSVCDMAGEDVLYADFSSFIYNDKSVIESTFTNDGGFVQ